jgi:hypothetical protein
VITTYVTLPNAKISYLGEDKEEFEHIPYVAKIKKVRYQIVIRTACIGYPYPDTKLFPFLYLLCPFLLWPYSIFIQCKTVSYCACKLLKFCPFSAFLALLYRMFVNFTVVR